MQLRILIKTNKKLNKQKEERKKHFATPSFPLLHCLFICPEGTGSCCVYHIVYF